MIYYNHDSWCGHIEWPSHGNSVKNAKIVTFEFPSMSKGFLPFTELRPSSHKQNAYNWF